MNDRSARAEVRNPILALPAARALQGQDPAVRAVLRQLFIELRDECRRKADECWRKHKAPMACYWKAAGVYCNHIARVLA